jgi:hypothetical protein
MMPEFDPTFARVCIWLTFTSLCAITICLPLIVYFLMRLSSGLHEERSMFRRERNQIADELEKLRGELAAKHDAGKGQ